jgi:tetratricopeptide (TPR) repeat protein
MSAEKLNNIFELLKAEKAVEAREKFYEVAETDSVEYFLLKGKLEQKFQNWGEALNSFSKVIEIEPQHVEAQNRLEIIRGILNFWNPEMFNP